MRASHYKLPSWVFLLFFFGFIRADPTAYIAYPSSTPKINYIDYVQVVWVSSWDVTRVFVVCSPNNGEGLVAEQGRTSINGGNPTSTHLFTEVGQIFAPNTVFPKSCSVYLISVGTTVINASATSTTLGSTIVGGSFVITSDASEASDNTVSWGDSLTTTLVSSTSTTSQTSSSISTTSASPISSSASISATSSPSMTATPDSKLSGGAIAGIVVGSVIGGALAGVAAWLILSRRRKNKQQDQPNNFQDPGMSTPGHEVPLSAYAKAQQEQQQQLHGLQQQDGWGHQYQGEHTGVHELSSDAHRPQELPAGQT